MLIAALLFPFALLQASDATAAPPDRFAQCLAAIDANAEAAHEAAMAWAADGKDVLAFRCAAMALSAQGRHDEAARRFDSLAGATSLNQPGLRAELFSQAGNSYLLAHEGARGRAALTQSVTLMAGDHDALPDILIDRARAFAMENDWRHAEEDLSRALDLRAADPLALRLRADVRMRQNAFALALTDAEQAVALEPANVDARLVLGRVREAQRTGEVPLD
jgi:tetratricopeptide (TPR) repeat protein